MAKRTTRKCSVCGLSFPSETVVSIGGKNYCEKCKIERDKEAEDYKALVDYIWCLSDNDNDIFPMITMQIKRLKENLVLKDRALKNRDILSTLKYMYEYRDPVLKYNPAFGISNIWAFYRDAQKFYKQSETLSHTDDELIKKSLTQKPIQIVINRSELIKQDEEFEEKKRLQEHRQILDLNEIDLEDDGEFVDNVIFRGYSKKKLKELAEEEELDDFGLKESDYLEENNNYLNKIDKDDNEV